MKCWLKADILPPIHEQSLINCLLEENGTVLDFTSSRNPIEQFETNITTDLDESVTTFQSQVLFDCCSNLSSIPNIDPEILEFIQEVNELNSVRTLEESLNDASTVVEDRAQSFLSDDEVQ